MLGVSYRIRFSFFVISVGFFAVDATFQCETKMISVGCFKDDLSDRALPTQLLNERDSSSPVFDGMFIHWKDKNYMPGFVCRCAKKAESLGYRYFGIQFYGECWSGENAHLTYNKHGKSLKCKRNRKRQSACPIEAGVGYTNYVYQISDRQCDTDFTPLGCFKDSQQKPRPVPEYTMNERDKSITNWDGYLIEWKNWNIYLPQLICRCAKLAKKLHHDIFAIQFYGECWTGKKIDLDYDRDGKSNKCVGMNYKACTCYGYHCAGVAHVNYVYEVSYIYNVYVNSDTPQDAKSQLQQPFYDYYKYPRYQNDGYFNRYRRKYLKRYDTPQVAKARLRPSYYDYYGNRRYRSDGYFNRYFNRKYLKRYE